MGHLTTTGSHRLPCNLSDPSHNCCSEKWLVPSPPYNDREAHKMAQCQLCKREFGQLKFATDHVKVCARCVNSINEFSEPAIHAQNRLGEKLARGMERNALRDLTAPEEWKRRRARWKLDNFAAAHAEALPGWLNDLLANERNRTRDYKTVRAHRRGLLRLDGVRAWSYPSNWERVAAGIRKRDGYACKACGKGDAELHVHHIIYLSNFGTNQQSNLVTLCRACHEKEHDHVFDFGERDDPEARNPLKPKPEHAEAQGQPRREPAEVLSPAPPPTPAPMSRPVEPPSEVSIDPFDRCGMPFEEVFFPAFGYVYRCTGCGYIPSLKVHDAPPFVQDIVEGPCEGALVLEHVESKASQPPAASGVHRSHSEQPEQRPASLLTRYEPVPDTEERLDPRILIPVAVLLGLVVILVAAMGMQ